MDKIKVMTKKEFNNIASRYRFGRIPFTKDYFATVLLYLLKDMDEIYFKGGTALQKIFLGYTRLSEDIDYTVSGKIEDIKKKIAEIVEGSGIFLKVTKDKDIKGFVRLLAHYEDFSGDKGMIFIDLNKRAKIFEKPEKHNIPHFYSDFIPEFSVKTLSIKEMVAEKFAATISRNKPRDHFDVYMLIKKGFKLDYRLAKKKCKQSGCEFDIVKMFNKARKLHKRWEEDMIPLLAEEIEFKEVIQTLAEYFDLKSHK